LARSRPIADPISEEVLESLGLISRDQALADMHFPEEPIDLVPARERLVFDELFRLELALALKKQRQLEESSGLNHDVSAGLVEAFIDGLPYDLTGAQIRSLEEIQADMASPHPMHRLLQGEVGSGKTAVAVASILTAVQGGYQGAVMAPTEVLADQHYIGMRPLCEQVGVRMGLLTGSSAERDETLAALIEGTLDVVVGTHALIQDGVTFANLGLAVIDEQHRFGVHQRVQLRQKGAGADPDLLIMTATPIPRTLAMTAYGDLDVSVLDEMPPGRSPVETTVVSRNDEDSIWAIMREEVAAGRQAFVVCPLVEESDALNVASAVSEHARLQALLSGLRVGLLHGQMKSQEKEAVMASMRDGGLDVLVATTVIEVGIDVPNATLMVIEDAQRFGLSQLHQLRGRVGRGQWPGRCIAISDAQWILDEKGKLANPDGQARLDAFESTTDGFVLAEADLKIRKQGTVLGVRQSGMPDLKLADIVDDRELLESARELAFGLVAEDPNLESHSDLADELRVLLGDETDLLLHS
jgi:ATP-dependent DNA helicase RecG